MDININVELQISATPEIAELIRALVKNMISTEPAKTQPAPAIETPTTEVINPDPAPVEAEAEAPTAETPAAESAKVYTPVDVREAIDRTRARIEGETDKDNPSSENYKKYHRQLNATFKSIAITLGAEKPSLLPAEKIPAFIAACDELYLDEYGTIQSKVPF